MDFERKIDEQQGYLAKETDRRAKEFRKNLAITIACAVIGIGLAFIPFWIGLGIGLAAAAFFGISILLSENKSKKTLAEIATRIAGFTEGKDAIRRDYRVHKLGTAYVPVANLVPFQGQSFLLDLTQTQPRQRFAIADIKDRAELASAAAKLDKLLSSIPIVDTTDETETMDTSEQSRSIPKLTLTDWSATLDRQLRRLSYFFSNLDEYSVDIPIIEPNSSLARYLLEFASDEPPDGLGLRLFDTDGLQGSIDGFSKLAEISDDKLSGEERDIETFCRDLMNQAATTFQLISEGRKKSLSLISEFGNAAFGTFLKASFNYYSPALEADNISKVQNDRFNFETSVDSWEPFQLQKSSRVTYDPISDNWVAEDGSRTSQPFGLHQIFEEVFMPMISNLMQENRLERLKVYNNIKDQKIKYLNDWHRDTDDFYARNRAEINEISNRIRSITADYLSDLNTYKAFAETIRSMGTEGLDSARVESINKEAENIQILQAQAIQYQAFINQFNERFENYRIQINQLAESFEHIEYFEASLRDGEARDVAQALSIQEWDERRRKLLTLGHQIAKNSYLPPAPSISDTVERDSMINLVAYHENVMADLSRLEEEMLAAQKRSQTATPTPGTSPLPEMVTAEATVGNDPGSIRENREGS